MAATAKYNIDYTNRLVAFVDILGFKHLVFSESNDKLNKYYEFVLNNFQQAVDKRAFEFLMISDSIVVYCENNKDTLAGLIKLINIQQAGLLQRGVLLRGAISSGSLHVDRSKGIIVGPGLINAYLLESKARYPRVILDRRLIQKHYGSFGSAVSENTISNLPHLTLQPCGGLPTDFAYLNYGRILATFKHDAPYKRTLQFIHENYYDNDHVEKFQWVKEHVLASLEAQLNYLRAIDSPNANELARIRKNEKYAQLFSNL